MNVWIITDTHWWQEGKKIDRPDNHTELQFKQWGSKVKADDLVIHVGDVTWNSRNLYFDLSKLPGRKVLVRGNHDKESLTWYMRNGFEFACESFVFKKVLFTHAPANELPGIAIMNVHGHLHGNTHRHGEFTPQPWHKLLAIENTHYAPVAFDKFVGSTGRIELV